MIIIKLPHIETELDIITNSSSEMFIVKDNYKIKAIDFLKSICVDSTNYFGEPLTQEESWNKLEKEIVYLNNKEIANILYTLLNDIPVITKYNIEKNINRSKRIIDILFKEIEVNIIKKEREYYDFYDIEDKYYQIFIDEETKYHILYDAMVSDEEVLDGLTDIGKIVFNNLKEYLEDCIVTYGDNSFLYSQLENNKVLKEAIDNFEVIYINEH